MSTKNPLIERIKKLLRLAKDKGATEAEAQTAMEKVQEILAEHNLSMAQVEEHTSETDDRVQGHKGKTTGKNNKWESHIFFAASDLNFCFYYTNVLRSVSTGSVEKLQHVVIGKPVNVLAAELLAEYLVETVNRMSTEYGKTAECFAAAALAGTSEAMAKHRFKQGMAYRLRARMEDLKKLRSQQQTKTTDGRNLPALSDAYSASQRQIQEWLNKADLGLKSKGANLRNVGRGFKAGMQKADEVGLDHQIEGTSAVPEGFRIGNR